VVGRNCHIVLVAATGHNYHFAPAAAVDHNCHSAPVAGKDTLEDPDLHNAEHTGVEAAAAHHTRSCNSAAAIHHRSSWEEVVAADGACTPADSHTEEESLSPSKYSGLPMTLPF